MTKYELELTSKSFNRARTICISSSVRRDDMPSLFGNLLRTVASVHHLPGTDLDWLLNQTSDQVTVNDSAGDLLQQWLATDAYWYVSIGCLPLEHALIWLSTGLTSYRPISLVQLESNEEC